jgi:ABC-type transport system involved in multi-copper enzyme maturation permease subunit
MYRQMVKIEQMKVFKRAIFRIELVLLALAVAALYIIAFVVLSGGSTGQMPPQSLEDSLTWPTGLTGALSVAAGPNLGGILMIVLVGALVAQEYTWSTLQLWLSRGVPRPVFLGAKFASLLVPAILLVLTALLVGGLISAVFSVHLLGELPFDQVDWGQLAREALQICYSLLPYAALTFFLAVISRSTVVSIGGGLAYTLLFEGIFLQLIGSLGGILGDIGRYLPGGLARGLLATDAGITVEIGDGSAAAMTYLEPGIAAIGIALYVLAFFSLSWLIFRRQDLTT